MTGKFFFHPLNDLIYLSIDTINYSLNSFLYITEICQFFHSASIFLTLFSFLLHSQTEHRQWIFPKLNCTHSNNYRLNKYVGKMKVELSKIKILQHNILFARRKGKRKTNVNEAYVQHRKCFLNWHSQKLNHANDLKTISFFYCVYANCHLSECAHLEERKMYARDWIMDMFNVWMLHFQSDFVGICLMLEMELHLYIHLKGYYFLQKSVSLLLSLRRFINFSTCFSIYFQLILYILPHKAKLHWNNYLSVFNLFLWNPHWLHLIWLWYFENVINTELCRK